MAKFKYCPDCGELLKERRLGDEGMVPWCTRCSKPWFPVFPAAIIALVYDENGEVLLLRQGYISDRYSNLVSGYIKPGESAEETAVREILEETGQVVEELHPAFTNWFARKEMMMIGYFARVRRRALRLSVEVDSAEWSLPGDALGKVHPTPTSTSRMLVEAYLKFGSNEKGS